MPSADIGRLRTFRLIVDLGSISAAASVLGYTQSAVSQQLAALEREVGELLVDRSQRPLPPPVPGRRCARTSSASSPSSQARSPR